MRAIFKKFQQHVNIVLLWFIWKTRVFFLIVIHKKGKPKHDKSTEIVET